MKQILELHVGKEIGINAVRAYRIDVAKLMAVQDDYFTVQVDGDDNVYHVPMTNLVKVIENPNGVTVGGGLFKQAQTHALVIKIGHVVEYAPT